MRRLLGCRRFWWDQGAHTIQGKAWGWWGSFPNLWRSGAIFSSSPQPPHPQTNNPPNEPTPHPSHLSPTLIDFLRLCFQQMLIKLVFGAACGRGLAGWGGVGGRGGLFHGDSCPSGGGRRSGVLKIAQCQEEGRKSAGTTWAFPDWACTGNHIEVQLDQSCWVRAKLDYLRGAFNVDQVGHFQTNLTVLNLCTLFT